MARDEKVFFLLQLIESSDCKVNFKSVAKKNGLSPGATRMRFNRIRNTYATQLRDSTGPRNSGHPRVSSKKRLNSFSETTSDVAQSPKSRRLASSAQVQPMEDDRNSSHSQSETRKLRKKRAAATNINYAGMAGDLGESACDGSVSRESPLPVDVTPERDFWPRKSSAAKPESELDAKQQRESAKVTSARQLKPLTVKTHSATAIEARRRLPNGSTCASGSPRQRVSRSARCLREKRPNHTLSGTPKSETVTTTCSQSPRTPDNQILYELSLLESGKLVRMKPSSQSCSPTSNLRRPQVTGVGEDLGEGLHAPPTKYSTTVIQDLTETRAGTIYTNPWPSARHSIEIAPEDSISNVNEASGEFEGGIPCIEADDLFGKYGFLHRVTSFFR